MKKQIVYFTKEGLSPVDTSAVSTTAASPSAASPTEQSATVASATAEVSTASPTSTAPSSAVVPRKVKRILPHYPEQKRPPKPLFTNAPKPPTIFLSADAFPHLSGSQASVIVLPNSAAAAAAAAANDQTQQNGSLHSALVLPQTAQGSDGTPLHFVESTTTVVRAVPSNAPSVLSTATIGVLSDGSTAIVINGITAPTAVPSAQGVGGQKAASAEVTHDISAIINPTFMTAWERLKRAEIKRELKAEMKAKAKKKEPKEVAPKRITSNRGVTRNSYSIRQKIKYVEKYRELCKEKHVSISEFC